jgi:hypothetical protein
MKVADAITAEVNQPVPADAAAAAPEAGGPSTLAGMNGAAPTGAMLGNAA